MAIFKSFHACALAGFLLYFAGCTQTISLYEGKRRPPREVATLEYSFVTHVKIDQRPIEQKPGPFTDYLRVEMLPGEHTVEWTELHGDFTIPFFGYGTLDARAGQLYVIRRNWLPGATRMEDANDGEKLMRTQIAAAATWIENAETGEAVTGIKPPWADLPAERRPLHFAR